MVGDRSAREAIDLSNDEGVTLGRLFTPMAQGGRSLVRVLPLALSDIVAMHNRRYRRRRHVQVWSAAAIARRVVAGNLPMPWPCRAVLHVESRSVLRTD